MKYKFAKIKLLIEQIAMSPFVGAGKIYGHLFPLKTGHNIFLFFPNKDIGGAVRVNSELARCVKDKKPLIIFSKKGKNNQFRDKFNIEGVRIIDIHRRIDNKLLHFINFFYRGVVAAWINKQSNPVVFGGESIFFYKVIPHIRKDIKCIELCHLDSWVPYSIGFIDRVNIRVFSTEALKRQVEQQYRENKLPAYYYKQLHFIDNATDIPPYKATNNDSLEIYFIGRGSPQKRVHLIAAIAEKINSKGLNVKFNFVGDVENSINPSDYPYCRFYGNVKDDQLIKSIYEKVDALILTSAFEGLPMVVMEAMANGRPVISTAVNGIPDYVKHLENGLLITATEEEDIINEGVELVELLLNNPGLKKKMGVNAYQYAVEHFSRESFNAHYTALLAG